MNYRIFISEDRLILVTIWENGKAEIATRNHPDAVWGPPLELFEETT